jgi:hypothetical protein
MSKRAEAERKAIAKARKIVAIWKARQAAVGSLVLPNDRCSGTLDLRRLDRH